MQRADDVEAGLRRISDARSKDAANLRAYVEEVKRLQDELRRAEVDALRRKADDLQQRASRGQSGLLGSAIQAQAAARQAAAELEKDQALRQIEKDRENLLGGITGDEASPENQERIFQIEKLSHDRRLAEEQRFQEELKRIKGEARADQLVGQGFKTNEADSISEAEQSLGRATSAFEQFRIGTHSNIEAMKAELPSLGAVFLQVGDAIAGSLATNIAAFVSGAVSIRKAAAEFFKAALAPVKDYLMKKSKIQFAEAIASLAAQDYRGFALHSLAGAALAAAAGLIDAGGNAIAGGGATAPSAGGAGAPSGSNTNRPEKMVIEQGNRTIEHVITIKAGPDLLANHFRREYDQNSDIRKRLRTDLLGEPAG